VESPSAEKEMILRKLRKFQADWFDYKTAKANCQKKRSEEKRGVLLSDWFQSSYEALNSCGLEEYEIEIIVNAVVNKHAKRKIPIDPALAKKLADKLQMPSITELLKPYIKESQSA